MQYINFNILQKIDNLGIISQRVLDHLRPKVYVALTYNNQELADNYISQLEIEDGFVHLQVE